MEYAKLQLIDTRRPIWRGASMHARGAAVTILAYCADQENEGRIDGAKGWTPALWKDAVDLRPIDLSRVIDAGLCSWDGSDLVCHLYDIRGQRALEVKRQQAAHGAKGAEYGRLGGRPRKADDKPHEGVSHKPQEGVLNNPHTKPPQSSPVQSIPPTPPSESADDMRAMVEQQPPPPPRDLGTLSDAEIIRMIGLHVRWRDSKDPERTAENRANVIMVFRRDPARYLRAAEQLRMAASRQVFPEAVEQELGRVAVTTAPTSPTDREITAIIRHHRSWQAAAKASEMGGVIDSEATLRVALTENYSARQAMMAEIEKRA